MKIQRTIPPAAAIIELKGLVSGLKGLIMGGKYKGLFEDELRQYFGVKHVFTLSSGKAALEVILRAFKSLRPERDEVVIPAYTCYSVPSSIVKAGLRVVPCDIDPMTLDFIPARLREAVREKTLCVVAGQLFGVPSNLEYIKNLCKDRGAFVVEDAAQSMGGSYKGKKLGTLCDAGFFSLGRGKNITCGSGGIVLVNSETAASAIEKVYSTVEAPGLIGDAADFLKMAFTAIFIRPSLYWFPSGLPFLRLGETIFYREFPVKRLSGMSAAVSRGWRKRLEDSNAARRKNAGYFRSMLNLKTGPAAHEDVPYLRLPFMLDSREARDRLYCLSMERGIGLSRMYPASVNEIDEIKPSFAGMKFPGAKAVSQRLLCLPTHELLGNNDMERIIGLIKSAAVTEKGVREPDKPAFRPMGSKA